MRDAFGPDVAVENIAVFESIALNTLPLRRANGILKGARFTASTLPLVAQAINKESAPVQKLHSPSDLPSGRMFYCEVVDDEMRSLFTVTDPAIVEEINNGTIDQTSVGMQSKHMNCSACGFDYQSPGAWENRYLLTCDQGHTIGEDGVFVWLDGCEAFLEYSLVGKGAVNGARIVGPSEQKLSKNERYKLAASASADGFGIFQLTVTPKETPNVDLSALLGKHELTLIDKADLTVKLAASEGHRAAAEALVAKLTSDLATANAQLASVENETVATLKAENVAAVASLQAEATLILTALGKPNEPLKASVPELVAQIAEHRIQLAAYVPTGQTSKPAGEDAPATPAVFSASAYQTRK